MSYDRLPGGEVNPRLIDAMVAGSKKSMLRAYFLWYFCGLLGFHNFYLGKYMLGGLQAGTLPFCILVFQIAGALDAKTMAGQAVGAIGIAALGAAFLSLLVDAFLIPSRVRAYSDRLRAQLEAEADWQTA